jgi:hypothetical protein
MRLLTKKKILMNVLSTSLNPLNSFEVLSQIQCVTVQYRIVADLINALPGNGSVNTIQHATTNNGVMQPISRQELGKHNFTQVQ